MHVYMYIVYRHTHTGTCGIYVYVYTNTRTHTFVCMNITHTHVYVYKHTHTCSCGIFVYMHVKTRAHIRVHASIFTYRETERTHSIAREHTLCINIHISWDRENTFYSKRTHSMHQYSHIVRQTCRLCSLTRMCSLTSIFTYRETDLASVMHLHIGIT